MAEQLTEEQLRELKLVFNIFDTNGNSEIDASELEKVLQAMNQNPTPEDVQELLEEIGADDGVITFEQFLQCAPSRMRSNDEEADMVKAAFRVFDKDGSGYISMDEAKEILQRGENGITDEEVDEFFQTADLDSDGRINLEEFATILNRPFIVEPNE
ncbi:calmodulin-alpha-like [Saccostrea cucullata]|uniref:calmodulin-alpha-like n=1 Tax=Saccostrea cuccullata TaxID=36930 RepID=UPI002ED21745